MSTANKVQIGGDHYKNGRYEHWDLITKFHIGYLEGNATKYVSRSRAKNGLQDLYKAGHYLDKLREIGEGPRGFAPDEDIRAFAQAQNLTEDEEEFVKIMCQWKTEVDLAIAHLALTRIIARA